MARFSSFFSEDRTILAGCVATCTFRTHLITLLAVPPLVFIVVLLPISYDLRAWLRPYYRMRWWENRREHPGRRWRRGWFLGSKNVSRERGRRTALLLILHYDLSLIGYSKKQSRPEAFWEKNYLNTEFPDNYQPNENQKADSHSGAETQRERERAKISDNVWAQDSMTSGPRIYSPIKTALGRAAHVLFEPNNKRKESGDPLLIVDSKNS